MHRARDERRHGLVARAASEGVRARRPQRVQAAFAATCRRAESKGTLMDQKRLFLAIAISLAIVLGFQWLVAPHLAKPPARTAQTEQAEKTPAKTAATPAEGSAGTAAAAIAAPVAAFVVRVLVEAALVARRAGDELR